MGEREAGRDGRRRGREVDVTDEGDDPRDAGEEGDSEPLTEGGAPLGGGHTGAAPGAEKTVVSLPTFRTLPGRDSCLWSSVPNTAE